MTTKKRKNPEALLQIRVRKMLDQRLPDDVFWIAGAAGLRLPPGTLMKAKASGVIRRGWPDLTFMHRGECLFIELKAEKGKLTEEQNAFRMACLDSPSSWFVCRSVEEVEQAIGLWGVPLKPETDFNAYEDDGRSFAEAFE